MEAFTAPLAFIDTNTVYPLTVFADHSRAIQRFVHILPLATSEPGAHLSVSWMSVHHEWPSMRLWVLNCVKGSSHALLECYFAHNYIVYHEFEKIDGAQRPSLYHIICSAQSDIEEQVRGRLM